MDQSLNLNKLCFVLGDLVKLKRFFPQSILKLHLHLVKFIKVSTASLCEIHILLCVSIACHHN